MLGIGCPFCCSRDLVGKHVDNHQRMRFRILELARHLFCRVKRVDVYQNTAGLEDTKGGNWKRQAIRHLQCHAVALRKSCHLPEIDRKGV